MRAAPAPPGCLTARGLLVAGLVIAVAAVNARAGTPETLSADLLQPGTRGTLTTVLSGDALETIELEILGVEANGIAPGVPLIFCRFVDERGRWIGVAAGMSGSPVTVDGKVIGALSYTIGSFSKEPICGITPIASMLALESYPGGAESLNAPASAAGARAGLAHAPLALVADGLAPGGREEIADVWEKLSRGTPIEIVPTAAAGPPPPAAARGPEGTASDVASDLPPGSAVSALLVWGDLKVGASGTVSWRDGDRILAFGHPFIGMGRAELPIARTKVMWTVPSLFSSFKIASIGEPVGTWTQDRLTAIGGRLGSPPRGLPVTVRVARPSRPEDRFEFHVVRDRFLVPVLAELIVRQGIALAVGYERSESLRMTATLRLAGGRGLTYFAGGDGETNGPAAVVLGAELSRRLGHVSLAPFELPELESVDVRVDAVEPGGGWTVARALPDRVAARPGETVRVVVDLEGPRGLADRKALELELPEDVPPGQYTLLTGSSSALAGEFGARPEARRRTARNADEYLDSLEDDASPTRLVLSLARSSEGIVARGRDYLSLPSTAHLMLRSRPGGNELYRARWLPIASATLELDRTLQRVAQTRFTVLPQESHR